MKNAKKIKQFVMIGPKTVALIAIPSILPYFLYVLLLSDTSLRTIIFLTVMIFCVSSFVFILLSFLIQQCVIFRKLKIDYDSFAISIGTEFSFLKRKFQQPVKIDLLNVYKIELRNKRVNPVQQDPYGETELMIADFYLFNETKESIILSYLSKKKTKEVLERIHYINPNIIIFGCGYKYDNNQNNY